MLHAELFQFDDMFFNGFRVAPGPARDYRVCHNRLAAYRGAGTFVKIKNQCLHCVALLPWLDHRVAVRNVTVIPKPNFRHQRTNNGFYSPSSKVRAANRNVVRLRSNSTFPP